MYESALAVRDAFDKRKNEVQYRVNQLLFSQEFCYHQALEEVTQAYQPLEQDGFQVRFFTVDELANSGHTELTNILSIAQNLNYDGEFDPLCHAGDVNKHHQNDHVVYYAVYQSEQLFALMQVCGDGVTQRIAKEQLERYFAGTVAKLSYRLTDYMRMTELMIADQFISLAKEAIVITDPQGIIVRVNESFSRITGYTATDVVNQTPRVLKSGVQDDVFYKKLWGSLVEHGVWAGEFINKTKTGRIYNQRGTISAIRSKTGELLYYAAIMEDVTELKHSEAILERINFFDQLTGLPNRSKLNVDYDECMASVKVNKHSCAVLLLDLDDFKHINDAMGHPFGDELLKVVAERLRNCVGQDGRVYRFGSDEFIVVTQHNANSTQQLVERLLEQMKISFSVRNNVILISCSIGIAISGRDGDTIDQLLSRADSAVHLAKETGRSRFAFSSDELQQIAYDNVFLRGELQQALVTQQMNLVFQPKRCMHDNHLVGCEALVRWHHPEHGAIRPDQFIPVAERSGMIVEIDYWVLETALQQLQQWRHQGHSLVPIAVNISLPTFSHQGFVDDVERLLSRYQIAGELLELEITERVALGNVDVAADVMRQLTQLGIGISMDDFGTGYSSLSYLNQLPISTLKIDRAFVSNIDTDELKQNITKAIVAMSKALGIKTVAEGVENVEELKYLAAIDCDQLQGFYYARPMTAVEFINWLNAA